MSLVAGCTGAYRCFPELKRLPVTVEGKGIAMIAEWDDETLCNRFDLYGALWAFCSRWHSGQGSRGYRILSRLSRADYRPGLGLQNGRFESERQAQIYRDLLRYRNEV